jgi:hypothetical protein
MIYKIEFDILGDDMCKVSIGVNNDNNIKGEYEYLASICWENCEPSDKAEIEIINIFEAVLEKRGQQELLTENIKIKLACYFALNEVAYFKDEVDENARVVPMPEEE